MGKKVALETVNNLVVEMTKNHPNQALVKKLMADAGLTYEDDLIKQMGSVLNLVSEISPNTAKTPIKEIRDADL